MGNVSGGSYLCWRKLSGRLKCLPHTSHEKAISGLLWVRSWIIKLYDLVNRRWQYLHTYSHFGRILRRKSSLSIFNTVNILELLFFVMCVFCLLFELRARALWRRWFLPVCFGFFVCRKVLCIFRVRPQNSNMIRYETGEIELSRIVMSFMCLLDFFSFFSLLNGFQFDELTRRRVSFSLKIQRINTSNE